MTFFNTLLGDHDHPLTATQWLAAILIPVMAAAAVLLPGLNAPLLADALAAPAAASPWQLPAAGGDYQPLALWLLRVEWSLFHQHLWGFRLAAFAAHATAALLVWRVGRRLRFTQAWLAGLIFAVHPLAILPIQWPAKAGVAWALAALLGSVLCYLRYLGQPASPLRWYAAAVLLFLAGALLHPLAAPLPLLLWLLSWWRREEAEGKHRSHRSSSHSSSRSSSRPSSRSPSSSVALAPAAPAAFPPLEHPPRHGQSHDSRHGQPGSSHSHGHSRHDRDTASPWRRLPGARQIRNLAGFLSSLRFTDLTVGLRPAVREAIQLLPFAAIGLATLAVNVTLHSRQLHATAAFNQLEPGVVSLGMTGWVFLLSLAQTLAPVPGILLRNPWAPPPAAALAWLGLLLPLVLGPLSLIFRRHGGRTWLLLLGSQFLLAATLAIFLSPATRAETIGGCPGLYLLLPAWLLALAGGLGALIALAPQRARKAATLFLAALLLAGVAAATLANLAVMRSNERFWTLLEKLDPGSPLIQTRIAHNLAGHRQYAEAGARYEQILKRHPAYAPALDGWAQCLLANGDSYLAIAKLEKAVELDPENPFIRFRLANALLDWNMDARAAEELSKARDLRPGFAGAALLQAAAMARDKRVSEASATLEAVTEKIPDYAPAYAMLGFLMAGRGDEQGAEARFQKAFSLAPDLPFCRLCRAWYLYSAGKEEPARADLAVTLKSLPHSALANLLMAAIAADAGQADAARRHLETALADAPRNPTVLTMAAALYGNHPRAELRDPARAIALAKNACQISENRNLDSQTVLALALANNQDLEPSERVAERALAIAEGNGMSRQADFLRAFLAALRHAPGTDLQKFLRVQIRLTDFADALQLMPSELKPVLANPETP